MNSSAVDICVVGAGVAGCVAARTLADAGASVVLLEAGPGPLPQELRSLDWLGKGDNTPWLWPGDYLRGRGLGGGSAINGMVAIVDDAQFYDQWPAGWRHQDLSPYLAAVESTMGTWQPPVGKLSQAINQITVPRGPTRPSATLLNLFADQGQRRTFADGYLSDAPAILEVRTNAEVERVVTYGNEAVGVQLRSGEQVDCDRLVLCAGTFGTAALLGHSGIDLNPRPIQDHKSEALTLDLSERFQTLEPDRSPTSARIEGNGFEILILDHLGSGRSQGALMVGETEEAGLLRGVQLMKELGDALVAGGVATRSVESPGGYYHAASTFPGGSEVDRTGAPEGWSRLHIMDASIMPSLVRCSPSVTIAAIAAMVATNLANN